jgi:hypothetical protein
MILPLAPRQLAARAAPADWPTLDADDVASHGADLSLALPAAGDVLRARCSLWWSDVPPLGVERLGVIGHFGAGDARGARMILDAACAELAGRGCTLAVGPMDGSTWRRHRLVVDAGSAPPFLLEPWNPPPWPEWWTSARFEPLAHWFSAANDDLARRDARADEVAPRLDARGIRIRALDADDFDAELRRIHDVARVAFRDNLLYTPLPFEPFAAQYRRIRPLVVPELVLLAEHGARTVGFAFSIPDAERSDARGRAVIVKTVAILPERALLGGLGSLLVQRTRDVARSLGLRREIHALMHERNQSGNISARTARPFRRYALYQRRLAPVPGT